MVMDPNGRQGIQFLTSNCPIPFLPSPGAEATAVRIFPGGSNYMGNQCVRDVILLENVSAHFLPKCVLQQLVQNSTSRNQRGLLVDEKNKKG